MTGRLIPNLHLVDKAEAFRLALGALAKSARHLQNQDFTHGDLKPTKCLWDDLTDQVA